MRHHRFLIGFSSAAIAVALAAPASAQIRSFSVPAQPAAQGLPAFAAQTGIRIVASGRALAGKRTNAVVGTYTVEVALARLLEGTGLVAETGSTGIISVRAKEADSVGEQNAGGVELPAEDDQQDIVVTGTNIRGAAPVGSPLISIDRRKIDESGYTTVQDVLRSLPQVFTGGPNANLTVTTPGDTAQGVNVTRGAGVNLRGLSAGATLTLINGRRMAVGSVNGLFSDVSTIPLSAIERIEVLPDGASALYGADAVGGVVNFILKRDYQGAESEARYGIGTRGDPTEFSLAQSFGTRWSSGSVMLSGEYSHRSAVSGRDLPLLNGDNRPFGGNDFRTANCRPGTLTVNGVTYAIPDNPSGTGFTAAQFTPATRNLCGPLAGNSYSPELERWSIVGRARQQIGPIELFVEGLYGRRDFSSVSASIATLSVTRANPYYFNPTGGTGPVTVQLDLSKDFGPTESSGHADAVNIAAGFEAKLFGDWLASGYGSLSDQSEHGLSLLPNTVNLAAAAISSDPAIAYNPFASTGTVTTALKARVARRLVSINQSHSQIKTINLLANGTVARVPGGAIKAALGAEYRDELQNSHGLSFRLNPYVPGANTVISRTRDVKAVFGELRLPLISEDMHVPLMSALELSAAARYEAYSDFGNAFDPRFGARWVPVEGLALRGTWSKSFRAPPLNYLDESANAAVGRTVRNPGVPSGTSIVLQLTGRNSALVEERARTWTAGADLAPKAIPGLRLGATYFHIRYDNKIELAAGVFDTAFTDPNFAGGVIVNPSAALRDQICSTIASFANASGAVGDCRTLPIYAIVDTRARNVSSVETSGLDGNLSYSMPLFGGRASIDAAGTLIFNYDRKASPGNTPTNVVDTEGDPIDFKARGTLGWNGGGFGIAITANYLDSYKDTISVPARPIASYTTIDLNLSYRLGGGHGPLGNIQIALNARNLFDRDPPFYNNAQGLAFDPSNAEPFGRFISVSLRKSW